jgi:hypothetical protein
VRQGEGAQLQELAGGLPQEQEAAVNPSDELAPLQLSERNGDRWTAGRDEVREQRVRQPQADDDSVGSYSAPATGEVPEQHVEPQVGARLMDDRHLHRKVSRSFQRAADQPCGQLGVP